MRERRWEVAPVDDDAAATLAAEASVPVPLARLLVARGITGADATRRFLAPTLDDLHDPFLLKDLDRAVARIEAAIASREKIAIHGDYDVDGVTSTVLLRRTIDLLGGDVRHFIPERMRDGYGLHPPAIERMHADGVTLIVSVDCGIRAPEAALRARALAVDLIITDHHEPDATMPAAYAVINPKRPDCPYPEKHLAGAGVALKVVQALCARAGKSQWLPAFVKIAALGTIADVVPLTGENRTIAKLGLASLSKGPHAVGLRALLESANLAGKALDSYHVSFVLAPRINAAGRMSTPDIAAELLLLSGERDADRARALAEALNDANTRRQEEEAAILVRARTLVDKDPDVGGHNVLVVAGEGWHRGVIGIVASKLVDAYCKPAIVLSIEGDVAHGSCRSVPGFDMLDALERCAELFDRFGGHRQAAGLAMSPGRIPEFRARVNAHADAVLDPADLMPRLRLDGRLPLSEITPALLEGLERMAPFGLSNPAPVFASGPVSLGDGPARLKEKHLSMSVRDRGFLFRAIAWRGVEWEGFLQSHRDSVEVAFSLERNTFRGQQQIELRIAAVREPLGAGTAVPS